MARQSHSTGLLNLPPELLDQIANEISAFDEYAYPSLLAYSWTCRYLHNVVTSIPSLYEVDSLPRSKISRDDSKPNHVSGARCLTKISKVTCKRELLAMENWPQYMSQKFPNTPPALSSDDLGFDATQRMAELNSRSIEIYKPKLPGLSHHACFSCMKLVSTSGFTQAQVTGKRKKIYQVYGYDPYFKTRLMSKARPEGSVKNVILENESKLDPAPRKCISCMILSRMLKPGDTVRYWNNCDDFEIMVCRDEEEAKPAGAARNNDDKPHAPTFDSPSQVTFRSAEHLSMEVGFVCKRCKKFAQAPTQKGVAAETERRSNDRGMPIQSKSNDAMQSMEFVRKTCTACLEYRPPKEKQGARRVWM